MPQERACRLRSTAWASGACDPDLPMDSKRNHRDRVFDHASIPATITKYFLGDIFAGISAGNHSRRFHRTQDSARGSRANVLSLDTIRTDCPDFDLQ